MPKVVGYTPPWLAKPSPGSKIFSDPEAQSPPPLTKRSSYLSSFSGPTNTQTQGPSRLLAQRGTETFAVVGNKIRWADLAAVKDSWELKSSSGPKKSTDDGRRLGDDQPAYRTLSSPVYYQIRQLAISPSGTFMAICTEHTVHIALLPDASRLRDRDHSPIRMKTYQLGPTTHVIPESPIMSVLWHPLAAGSDSEDCLITVTAEAAVRVWEIDRSNQWSFEKPSLAIDLRRLADGGSCDDNFEPAGFGKSRGFSVDAFDMEVSAACFGGNGGHGEDPWASMTLWTAMRTGDLYALCPLLPSKWKPNHTALGQLSVDAIAKYSVVDDADDAEGRVLTQQYEWLQDVDAADHNGDVRERPSKFGVIPKLQGPFEVPLSDSTVDVDVSDVYLVPAKYDQDPEDFEEDEEDQNLVDETNLLPYTVICLATTDGQVYVSLDVEGVSGQWLPKQSKSVFAVPEADAYMLVPLGTLQTAPEDSLFPENDWPMFTSEPSSPYSFFLTSTTNISSITMSDWLTRFAEELSSTQSPLSGLKTRLEALCQDKLALTDHVLKLPQESSASDQRLSCPVILSDSNLGYFLLTSAAFQGYAVCFDEPHSGDVSLTSPPKLLALPPPEAFAAPIPEPSHPPRVFYNVPEIFKKSQQAPLSKFMSNASSRNLQALKQTMKLSPAVLDTLVNVHRSFAPDCSRLETAAAELFRKCERLQKELHQHVEEIVKIAEKLQSSREHIETRYDEEYIYNNAIEKRMKTSQGRQQALLERFDKIRKKSARAGESARAVSTKEREWMDEIATLSERHGVRSGSPADPDEHQTSTLSSRIQEVSKLLSPPPPPPSPPPPLHPTQPSNKTY